MPDLFDQYGHPIVNIDAGATDLFDQYGRPYVVPVYPASVAFTAGTLAARPAAGTEGALYFATDEQVLYRDNGSAWVQVAYSGAPTVSVANLNLVDDASHIMELIKRGLFRLSNVIATTAVAVGTGNGYTSTDYGGLNTGADAGSSYLRYRSPFWMPGRGTNLPWSRRMILITSLARFNLNAAVTLRAQLKEANTIGQVAQLGIELEVRNLSLYGAGYKTARVETAKLADLTEWSSTEVMIDHQPSVPKIDFYVDNGSGWVLAATITDPAGIPVADSLNNSYAVWSIDNAAVAFDGGAFVYPWSVWISRT